MSDFDSYRDALLDRIAGQWIALGAQISGQDERTVIDLEGLIAATAAVAMDESRIRDAAFDWCVEFGTVIHSSRLKHVAAEVSVPASALAAFATEVAHAGGPRWSLAGQGGSYVSRRKVRARDLRARSRLSWRVRSVLGVNARADILTALLSMPAGPFTIAELARRTRYSKRNIASAVSSLSLAEVTRTVRRRNEDLVSLEPSTIVRGWLEPTGAPDIDWVSRWLVACHLLRALDAMRASSQGAWMVESRVVARTVAPQLGYANLPAPDLRILGGAFIEEFDRWASGVELILTMHGA